MPDRSLPARLEQQLEQAGINALVEQAAGVITLSGRVASVEERQAAEEIASGLAPDQRIDNNLEVETVLPTDVQDFQSEEPSAELAESVAEIQAAGGELEPDFTDQAVLTDPAASPGSSSGTPGASSDDPVAEGEDVYFPPTDPVVTTDRHGQAQVLGGFTPSSTDTLEPERSALNGESGDEAIADAIRQELREDASTTDLEINLVVRQGVVLLRGSVPTLEDAQSAEEIAARVPGVREVVEELEVAGLGGTGEPPEPEAPETETRPGSGPG
jgi:osmotically-inducible protein OsmY